MDELKSEIPMQLTCSKCGHRFTGTMTITCDHGERIATLEQVLKEAEDALMLVYLPIVNEDGTKNKISEDIEKAIAKIKASRKP